MAVHIDPLPKSNDVFKNEKDAQQDLKHYKNPVNIIMNINISIDTCTGITLP